MVILHYLFPRLRIWILYQEIFIAKVQLQITHALYKLTMDWQYVTTWVISAMGSHTT